MRIKRTGAAVLTSLLFCLLVLNAPAIHAQAPKQSNAGDQALRKAQGMLRQIGQEKAALEAEKSELLQQVKNLEAEVKRLQPLQQEIDRYRASTENLQGLKGKLESDLEKAQKRAQKQLKKQQKIIDQARQIQNDNQLLVAAVQEREQWINVCTANNSNLVEINQELLNKYQKKGFFQKLGELELLTGISNVTTENLVESYQYRLEDLTVTRIQKAAENN